MISGTATIDIPLLRKLADQGRFKRLCCDVSVSLVAYRYQVINNVGFTCGTRVVQMSRSDVASARRTIQRYSARAAAVSQPTVPQSQRESRVRVPCTLEPI